MRQVLIAMGCAAALLHGSIQAFAAESTAQGTTLAQESPDQWRSSKLVGVPIYGPDNKSVGKITDMLMSKDGKVAFVIIGVGGFLGIGEKDVAIPFDAVDFTDKPITQPVMPVNNNLAATSNSTAGATATGTATPATGGMSANGGVAPATTVGLGTPTDATANAVAPANGAMTAAPATTIQSTAYPDHGMIAMNKDQLKQAPTFTFAR